MKKKICPLMSSKSVLAYQDCLEKRCALWDDLNEECALLEIRNIH
jgi:hypothetical protein